MEEEGSRLNVPLAMVVRLGVQAETDSLPVWSPTADWRITRLKKAWADSRREE